MKRLTLGIETSCDETSAAVIRDGRVLSNAVSSSVHLHKKYGGVVPEIASRYHVEYIIEVLSKALENAHARLDEIGLIAVANGPGLVGALLVGISMAKALSYSLGAPLVGVNHITAHLYSALLADGKVDFPFVGLVVSGGHTCLFYCEGFDKVRLLGQTQDDAAGEAYDKTAKILGLGYPGGPVIDRLARQAKVKDRTIFPRSYLGKDSLDFSFSGIKTAVLYYVRDALRASGEKRPGPEMVKDVCYAFQESVIDVLVEKSFRAASAHNAKRIVVGGGVAANSRLREKMAHRAAGEKRRVYFPKMEYCMDNAAMIGFLGEKLYNRGHRSDLYLNPKLEAIC